MVAINNTYRLPERPVHVVDADIQNQVNDLRQRLAGLECKLSAALGALKAERAAARAAEAEALEATQECALTLVSERTDSRKIAEAVAKVWGITVAGLISPRRSRDVAYPRHAAFLLTQKYCHRMSLPMIGRAFGGRDHKTIVHGATNAERLLRESPAFAAKFAKAEAIIKGATNG